MSVINEIIASIIDALPLLLQGGLMTVKLWLGALSIALMVGIACGIAQTKRLRQPWLSPALHGIIFLLRGIPFYVQLLIAYFVIPELIGIDLSATTAAMCSLGLCSAAYISEIVRGSTDALSRGQWEAAFVLGYSTQQTVRYVIIPQMLRAALPALIGECDQVLKSTAIISALGVMELTGAAKNIIARDMNPLTIYLTLAACYLLLSSLLTVCGRILERKLCRSSR